MKSRFAGAVSAALLVAGGCSNPESFDTAESAVGLYTELYGCAAGDLEVSTGVIDSGSPLDSSTIAIGEEGIILFNKDLLPELTEEDIYNTGLHEATHACDPADTVLFEEEIDDGQGNMIYGVDGFSPLVRLTNGQTTLFTLIEEGSAEALAMIASGDYISKTPQYDALGRLTLQLMDSAEIDSKQLANLIPNNGLLEFIGKANGSTTVSSDEILEFMTLYQDAFDS